MNRAPIESQNKKILVAADVFWRLDKKAAQCLEAAGFSLKEPSQPLTEETLRAELSDCVAVIAGTEPYTERVFAACPELRVIARWGVGYDNIDVAAATRYGIMVLNTPGVVTEAVADMTFALILGIARRLPQGDRAVREGQWPRIFSSLVYGKTLGVIGLGQIGQAVIRRAKGFDMRILGYDPYCEEDLCQRLIIADTPLEKLLAESDFVTLHCSLTPETTHLINRERLQLMKPTAYLINAGRGGLVDQAALTEALQKGWIAGAALDVLAQEPPDRNDPLLKLDNVLLMPHVSSFTYDTVQQVNEYVCANILAAFSGQQPRSIVNPEVLKQKQQ